MKLWSLILTGARDKKAATERDGELRQALQRMQSRTRLNNDRCERLRVMADMVTLARGPDANHE